MKRTILGFVISALVLAGLAVWALAGHISGNAGEIAMAAVVLVLVGFAVFVGLARLRSLRRHEPADDEMSKSIMTRASSLAFYVSIYLWLFVMYVSDKVELESHSLIGAGIAGMAVVFLFSWLGVRLFGMTHHE
jgi:hypothetical protein